MKKIILAFLMILPLSSSYALTLLEYIANNSVEVVIGHGENIIDLSSKELTDIEGIDTLIVKYNQQNKPITAVPDLILILSRNAIKELPGRIDKLVNLQALGLHQNQLKTLHSNIGNLKRLQWLVLSNNELTQLPNTIGSLTKLQYLYLKNNEISLLPEAICQLKDLRLIDLSLNQLKSLPINIDNLTSLKTFNLNNNKLDMLPASIGNLVRLHTLNLSDNELVYLPVTIGNMVSLKELDLCINQLTELPDSICNLINLKNLRLYSNDITALPASIENMHSLSTLDVEFSLHAAASEILKNNKKNRKAKLLDWNLVAFPLRYNNDHNELDLGDMPLTNVQGISQLKVKVWKGFTWDKVSQCFRDSNNKKITTYVEWQNGWKIKNISEVDNLGINLAFNSDLQDIPVDELVALARLIYFNVDRTKVNATELSAFLSRSASIKHVWHSIMNNEELDALIQEIQERNDVSKLYVDVREFVLAILMTI